MTEAVEMHVRRFFRGHPIAFERWGERIEARLPAFRVMVVAPGPRTALWSYVSIGANRVRRSEHGLEFFVQAPAADEAHVELVTMVAHYHANPDETHRLGLGPTLPIERQWLPGSACDHLLVSKPYQFGPDLERCDDALGHVQLLWLLPITAAERAFKIAHGLEALEQRFESARLEYWKPERPSVV
jgi:hypothetical protein